MTGRIAQTPEIPKGLVGVPRNTEAPLPPGPPHATCTTRGLVRVRQGNSGVPAFLQLDVPGQDANVDFVDVVLRKLGKGARPVAGRLVRAPRKGSVVVIEFPDGMHEYVTTPVKRVLRLAGREVFYIETINSRYRLEVRNREDAVAENAG